MKESSKFLIGIIIIVVFAVTIIGVMGVVVNQVAQEIASVSSDTEMKTETFNSTTISVPESSNFTEESGVYVDTENGLIIEVTNESIPESQLQDYAEAFENQSNVTQINSIDLANNTIAFKGSSNETIVFVVGENQTIIIAAQNQELAFKMAKTVKFSG